MAKKSVSGSRKPEQRTFPPVARAAAAAGVMAASVYAVNLSAAEPGQLAGSVAPAGVNPGVAAPFGTPDAGTGQKVQRQSAPPASDQVVAGALPPAILSNPQVTLAFPHTSIGGADQVGPGALTLGPAGAGRPLAGFLMSPLQSLDASSPYGLRVSPLSGTAGDFHLGQDYAAACGTPVYAADSGVVRAAGWHPWGGGNRIEIDHGDGLITTYNHLESIGVRTGDTVKVGQVVARVGTTGWSTGCHLHFEAILNGRYTNPLRWSFLQLRALGQVPADMVSFAPGQGTSTGTISWTIPLQVDPGDGSPAAGLLPSPFPPLLPRVPNPLPSEPTGIVLPPPSAQRTTSAPPPPEPSGGAVPPSSGPAPSGPPAAEPAPAPSPTSPSPSPSPAEPANPTPTPTEPAPTGPVPSDPAPTEPVPSEPAPTEPVPSEPAPSEPAPSEPVPAPDEPDPIEPAPTEPAPIEPVPSEPAPSEPAPTDPVPLPTEPAPIEPAPIEPAPIEPAPIEPAPIEPAPIEPAPIEPAPIEPAPIEPAPIEPAPIEPVPPPPEPAPAPQPSEPLPTAPAPEPAPTTVAPAPSPTPSLTGPAPTTPPA
ncbi:murein DD-endopeptidase MepM/ murein hydrolase activator NlpD [Arthrobacter oryzae]|uniref:M23 family metallopeptidase n=1 Tax=Arthrobacter TaxID=1663 RepID=UPI0027825225|nr:M23 family metallopeptidase [Arthrobacter oryzae]MDP9986130.1 murein DD-endopeptidase MepM/ murein hydrolase activator NlpD [Arthrobacter oryzae]